MKITVVVLAASLATLAACGGEDAAPAPGTSGPADQLLSGSHAGLTAASAIDEAGTQITGTITGERFSLSLPAGHVYRLQVDAGRSGRIVFPRGTALDAGVRVRAGVAPWDLGLLQPVTLAQPLDGGGGSGGEDEAGDEHDSCHDGVDAVTGAACTDDDDGVECESEDDDAELSCDDSCAGSDLYEPANNPPTSFGDCTEDGEDGEDGDDGDDGSDGSDDGADDGSGGADGQG